MELNINEFLLTFIIMLVFYIPLTGFTELPFWVAALLSLPGAWFILLKLLEMKIDLVRRALI